MRAATNMNSSSQLSVHSTLPCPEGQSAWALAHSLFGELPASCRKNVSGFSWADIVPLGVTWACACCRKRWCDSLTLKTVAGALFVVFVGLLFVVALVFMRISFR